MLTTDELTRIRPRLLVVDDDDFARRFFLRSLRASYQIDAVASGAEAEALMAKRSYDAVLSDVSMQDMDGIELLKRIRERDPDLPVVLVTGAPHVGSAIEAVAHGAFRYLVKPLRGSELCDTLGEAVERRERARVREEALALFGERERRQGRQTERLRQFELALDGLFMLYQPIVDTNDGGVFAHEALVRSRSQALTHPVALLDAAESLGEVFRLGRRIRSRVADDLMLLPRDSTLFVNVHAQELLDEELYLENASLTRFADRVVLEVTERARLGNVDDLADRVARLRGLGFRLAIDDLGSGYSALSSVVALEPDFVKVDMTLVRDVGTKPKSQRLIQSILDLGRGIGLNVILEGVETKAEADTLVGMGAHLLQGYHFGRPAPLGRPRASSAHPVLEGSGTVIGTR